MTNQHIGKKSIVVGDVVMDHYHYEAEQPRSNNDSKTVIRAVRQLGGAATPRELIHSLIAEGAAATGKAWEAGWDVHPDEPRLSSSTIEQGVHAYGV
jgi:bifunctional ADP-heptose synthase (sugar kinase/adenylyltransferase)